MANNQTSSSELFRYAKIIQPRIIDISLRATKYNELNAVLKKTEKEKNDWANQQISKKDAQLDKILTPYFSLLKIKNLPENYLPTQSDITDLKNFKALVPKSYDLDLKISFSRLVALKILSSNSKLNDENELKLTARIYSFLDVFPILDTISDPLTYAYPVFKKEILQPIKKGQKPVDHKEKAVLNKQNNIKEVANNIFLLWNVRNNLLKTHQTDHEKKLKDILYSQPLAQKTVNKTESKKTKGKKTPNANSNVNSSFAKERARKLQDLKNESADIKKSYNFNNILNIDTSKLKPLLPNLDDKSIKSIQVSVKDFLKNNQIISNKFCEAYEKVLDIADQNHVTRLSTGNDLKDTNITYDFKQNPHMYFEDTLRILGNAKLIKVEEHFMGYVPAEISYIENIQAGETKTREVKSTKYFEQVSETDTEKTDSSTEEKDSTTKLELSSQIKNEINTRFNSDVNASASGSAGGKMGVVDFSGNANVNAHLGVGVDTNTSTDNSSKLSQEIVNKAIENTKKTVIEKRMSRTYSLYETTDLHKIENSTHEPVNSIYCFLDKQVCITETQYSVRMFLLANLSLPGQSLLSEKKMKQDLANHDLIKPIFDLTPDQLTPANYMEQVGRYKAYNVQPPPPPVIRLSRTYKTDVTNANMQQEEFNMGKMAKALTPFFEKYKRHLVAENIKIPDGYCVNEVCVSVNHGKNGISIPAELPLKLIGSALGTYLTVLSGLTSGVGAVLVPLGIWQFEYSVSPLMYYNSDSSNVTICIGNESQDSSYYFFPTDLLIRELLDFLGGFADKMPSLIQKIQDYIEHTLTTEIQKRVAGSLLEVKNFTKEFVDDIVGKIRKIFEKIRDITDLQGPHNVTLDEIKDLRDTLIPALSIADVNNWNTKFPNFQTLFEPLQNFISEVLRFINEELSLSISEFFKNLELLTHPEPTNCFYSCQGMRGEIPLTLNIISINPGVTVNLVACLCRTDEALAKWQLDTYNALYQSYLQQVAEYESKLFTSGAKGMLTRNPESMREEEMLAIKEKVLYCMNNFWNTTDTNEYNFMHMNLFENAVDWSNVSYKLYNYGPNADNIRLEKGGIFDGADDRRKAFIKSLWAQVLIPLQDNETLETAMRKYLTDRNYDIGQFALNSELESDEMTALYQDLILNRELSKSNVDPISKRCTLIPTDFIYLKSKLPRNKNTKCEGLTDCIIPEE